MTNYLNIIISIVKFIIIVIPIIGLILNHINSAHLSTIKDATLRITKALEETGLEGKAKKDLAATKIGEIVKSIPFFNLTEDQINDFIDATVTDLRTLGVKSPLILTSEEPTPVIKDSVKEDSESTQTVEQSSTESGEK